MINISKFEKKVEEANMSIEALALKIGIDKLTMYEKLKGDGKEFSVNEVVIIVRELKLDMDEINEIFFE